MKTKIKNTVLCASFSSLIAVGAFIRIPMPVVAFTLQVLFTTLSGIILGAKLGLISVLVYITMGLIGIPIFTEGGGIAYVLKPTFGYLIGFAVATYFTGKIAHQRTSPSFKRLLTASFLGLLIIYAIGIIYYYMISHLYLNNQIAIKTVLLYCFLLTIPGDILSCFIASSVGKQLIPLIKDNII